MDFKEIEALITADLPLADNAEYCEYSCYECLKALYSDYRKQIISKEIAGAKKKKLRMLYDAECKEQLRYTAALAQYQENIRNARNLRSEINKSDDVLEIALKACECIGLMCGEMVSYGIVKRRLLSDE